MEVEQDFEHASHERKKTEGNNNIGDDRIGLYRI